MTHLVSCSHDDVTTDSHADKLLRTCRCAALAGFVSHLAGVSRAFACIVFELRLLIKKYTSKDRKAATSLGKVDTSCRRRRQQTSAARTLRELPADMSSCSLAFRQASIQKHSHTHAPKLQSPVAFCCMTGAAVQCRLYLDLNTSTTKQKQHQQESPDALQRLHGKDLPWCQLRLAANKL